MATRIALNEVWTTTVGTYITDQVGLNNTHWKCTGVTGIGALDTQFALDVDTRVSTPYRNLLTNSATYWGVRVVRKVPAPVGIPQVSAAFTGAGAVFGSLLPKVTAGVLRFRTLYIGRTGRGRNYIPFPDSLDSSAGSPTPGYLTRLQLLGAAITPPYTVDSGGGNTSTMVMVITGPLLVSPTYPVTSYSAATQWGEIHKRGGFGKQNPNPPF